MMKNKLLLFIFSCFFLPTVSHAARVKEIASIKGFRENLLIGYGVVVGLKGTGDSGTEVTSKSMARLFEKLGIATTSADFKSKNVAAVIVTAKLPPFARAGTKIDVSVSSIGDASSLEGGTLLVTPLRAGDQNVYAVAQGAVSLGQLVGSGTNFPTAARVPNGALIEREVEGEFTNKKTFVLSLASPDFTTAARLVKQLNTEFGGKYATARDAGTIDLITPFNYEGNGVEFLAIVENIELNPDTKAKVVLNEKTGTVIIGENVRIQNVAISHGDLTIEVGGGTQTTGTNKKGAKEKVGVIEGASIKEIVRGLNMLGASPKEMTAIFQSLRAAGALQAELEVL